jgi:small subunit ribosomal protein S20
LANSKSARKRILVAQRRHDSRRPYISACRTLVKKANLAIQSGDEAAATTAVGTAVRMLDRTARKGVIHANNAARRKSRLMAKYNGLTRAA